MNTKLEILQNDQTVYVGPDTLPADIPDDDAVRVNGYHFNIIGRGISMQGDSKVTTLTLGNTPLAPTTVAYHSIDTKLCEVLPCKLTRREIAQRRVLLLTPSQVATLHDVYACDGMRPSAKYMGEDFARLEEFKMIHRVDDLYIIWEYGIFAVEALAGEKIKVEILKLNGITLTEYRFAQPHRAKGYSPFSSDKFEWKRVILHPGEKVTGYLIDPTVIHIKEMYPSDLWS